MSKAAKMHLRDPTTVVLCLDDPWGIFCRVIKDEIVVADVGCISTLYAVNRQRCCKAKVAHGKDEQLPGLSYGNTGAV